MIATRIQWRHFRGVLAGTGVAVHCATARAVDGFVPLDAVARITAESYEWRLLALYAALAICGVVLGAMIVSMRAHRKAAARAAGAFHPRATVEIAWALIPWVIIFGTAWPATRALFGIESPANADITIKAMGLQWKWGYEYLDGEGEGIAFDSNVYAPRRPTATSARAASEGNRLDVDNPVVVPVGKRIRMVLEANHEIHSWHVPSLGVKQYAVPGLVRDTWFHASRTGTYRGLCSIEACGAGRACVLVVVKVVSDGDFRRWVEGRKRGMAAEGRETALRTLEPSAGIL